MVEYIFIWYYTLFWIWNEVHFDSTINISNFFLWIVDYEGPYEYVKGIEKAEDLLSYILTKYAKDNNVVKIQLIFIECDAPKLYQMCLQYAETTRNDVTFLRKSY